ncbi:MAG: hypothetical protein ACRCT8_17750 [Lacipirellulaceae bacterium]
MATRLGPLRDSLIGWFCAALVGVALSAPARCAEFPALPQLPALSAPALHTVSLDVGFDVPPSVVCRDVTTGDWLVAHPDERLVEVVLPVSLVLYRGEPGAIEEVVIEVDGSTSNLRVIDYTPRTELTTEHAAPIERKQSDLRDTCVSASLGGKLGSEIALTPGADASFKRSQSAGKSELLLPPRDATTVSGTVSGRGGVYYKLRPSSQTTLEGEHAFGVTFAAPRDWRGGGIEVRCVARGAQKWLFVEQQRVWSEVSRPVAVRLVSHTAAKPVVGAACEYATPQGETPSLAQADLAKNDGALRVNTATGPTGVDGRGP